jgi:hypothetical protein
LPRSNNLEICQIDRDILEGIERQSNEAFFARFLPIQFPPFTVQGVADIDSWIFKRVATSTTNKPIAQCQHHNILREESEDILLQSIPFNRKIGNSFYVIRTVPMPLLEEES